MSDFSNHFGGIVRTGLHKPLEDAANEILRQHLSGITRNSEKSDILTPWKEQDRKNREIYVKEGTPDPSVRRGIFSRSAVRGDSGLQHLNSMQGQVMAKKSGRENPWDAE